MQVYVLNHKGNPIMPCSPRKARVMLKEGKVYPAAKAKECSLIERANTLLIERRMAISLGIELPSILAKKLS